MNAAHDGESAPTPPRSATRARPVPLPVPLAIATLGLTYWCVDIVAPALPAIQGSLGLSATGAGLVFALFFGGRLAANLPAALLVDRAGPRVTAIVGAAALLAGSVGAGLAVSEWPLLAARGVQGAGVALLATAGLLSVLRALPAGGAAMTAFNAATGIGGAAGLVSAGLLTGRFGWESVFVLSAALAAVLLVGTVIARPVADTARAGDALGPLGPLATKEAPAPPQAAPPQAVAAALAANLLVFANYSVWVVALPLFAAGRFGASVPEIGTLLLGINALHVAAAFPAGGVIRRLGAARTLPLGFGLAAVGLGLSVVAPAWPWLFGTTAFYAVGQVVGNSSAGDLLLRLGGGGGRAVGMVRLSSDVGLVAGPAAVGVLADTAGVPAPFVALAALSAGGAIVAAVAAQRRQTSLKIGRRRATDDRGEAITLVDAPTTTGVSNR